MPIVISLYLLAAGPVGAQAPTPHDMLTAAIRTLEARDSISAKVHCGVNLFEQRLDGAGIYLEQRPGRDHLLRLELRLQLGDQSSSLVTVCDGRYLYQYRNLPNRTPDLTRIDIIQAIRSLERTRGVAAPPALLPGLGGLPRVLRGLDEYFDFTRPAERGQRAGQQAIFWRLEGEWKRPLLTRLLPDQSAAIEAGRADVSRLPVYVPDRVAIELGEADYFPYRIEFNRRVGEAVETLVFVVFSEVAINERIDPAQFVYNPPHDAPFADKTDSFIETLKGRGD